MNRGGFGFVRRPGGADPDVYISRRHLGDAVHGDLVEISLRRGHDEQFPEGRIERVVERSAERLLGTVERSGRGLVLIPSHPLLPSHLSIFRAPDEIVPGLKVLFRFRADDLDKGVPRAEILEVLGDAGDPMIDARVVEREFDLPAAFPEDVLSEAAALADPAASEASVEALLGAEPEREDLRSLPTITIDPVDARDFDDAVGAEAVEGGFRLWVHIADVSHYVRPGTKIDGDAYGRGTSVYFSEAVVPMLPPRLSEELCSLRPREAKLAMTTCMDLSASGAVRGAEVFPSVIRSDHRLSYEEAQAILDGKRAVSPDLAALLERLASVARLLRERRFARGALDLDVPEAEVEVDRSGEPVALRRRASLFTHHLIEECMLAANEAVGRIADRERLPFIYRVHDAPDPERLEQFFAFLLALGIPPPREPEGLEATALEKVLERPMAPGIRRLVHSYLLRSMKKARYQPEDIGHYGLAARLYCHFTSPIRRYPDLVDHRIMKSLLAGRHGKAGLPGPDLESVAQQSSELEVRAEQAERGYHRVKAVRFARGKVGETFTGTVTGVIPAGAFVELDEFPLDGFIARATLGGYHRFDPAHFRLVATHGGGGLAVGDAVEVLIARADVEAREVDFELVTAARRRGPKLPMPGEKKAAGRRKGTGRREKRERTDPRRARPGKGKGKGKGKRKGGPRR
jgi:ribonuclease R